VADRLASVKPVGRFWVDAPYLTGSVLVWEQLHADGSTAGQSLWERADAATATGLGDVRHGDWAGYAQGALDLYRLLPLDQPERRSAKLAVTDGPLRFAERVIRRTSADGPPLDPWWVLEGYGSRYWQDDLFMVVPWLAMRGSSRPSLPADALARDLAWEWVEAYAFDHRAALEATPDRRVPLRRDRRRRGWALGERASGRLLLDPATGLWWHDEGGPGSSVLWARGNGWVAAALARAQQFLDRPYAGGRFAVTVDRGELRLVLARMARSLVDERDVFGLWGSDVVRGDLFPEPEASGSALITYVLALGVNQGWLEEEVFAPPAVKAFHALSKMVDDEGDLHHIQSTAGDPESGELLPSDDPDHNLNYGVGAYLMAAAEVSRLPGRWLDALESTEAMVVERSRFRPEQGWLVIHRDELGEIGRMAAAGRRIGGLSSQQVLAAELVGDEVRVEDRGSGDVALFHASTPGLARRGRLVPAVANSAGTGGTRWRSEVVLFNPRTTPQRASLELRLPSAPGGALTSTVTVPARSSVRIPDPVGASGLEGTGPLLVRSRDGLVVTSRTFNDHPDGTFGQLVPAWEQADALLFGEETRLLLLGSGAGRRTNLGCASLATADVEVSFTIHALGGEPVGEVRGTVPAGQLWQRTDALAGMGVDRGYAVVRVLTPGGSVAPYASVVDAGTGDPTLVTAPREVAATPGGSVVARAVHIPAAAHVPGLGGTLWRTELELHNPGDDDATVDLALLPSRRNNTSPAAQRAIAIPAGGSVRFDDTLGEAFSAHGTAALRVTPRRGTVMVASRTFTRTAAGALGQHVPGMTLEDAVFWGERGVLTHLSSSPDPGRGSRTNVGLVNLTGAPVVAVVELFAADGSRHGERRVALPPHGHAQLNGVAPGMAWVEVWTPTADGALLAYASVVDNRSGDPTFIPVRRLEPSPRELLVLDHRRDCVLVDQLPEAVGTSALPAGRLTATVTGGGNLGRHDLPLRAACLYRSDGRLRAASLAPGERLEGVDGGAPFWCFVPDRVDRRDNRGSLRVTLSGGADTLHLDLDAVANCVLLDTLPQGRAEEARGGTWALATTGDLGAPYLPPQLLVMYRDEQSGELTSEVVADGSQFGPVAPSTPLLAVALDWLRSDDNTGASTLRVEGD